MKKIKEIVVISGKGGTGKTTVAACLAEVIPEKVIVDADVDAANMYLLMKPKNIRETDFIGKSVAHIDHSICTYCNLCRELCRFKAIDVVDSNYVVEDISCEGCGLCQTACPADAINMVEQVSGKWFLSTSEFGDFVYARLKPGGENSGNLVTRVKYQAKLIAEEKKINTILTDGPPGIGCPVISTLSGSDYTLIITEPTFSGISDLERILKLSKHFNVSIGIIINKYDINLKNTKKIEKYVEERNLEIVAKIPHSFCIIEETSNQNIPLKNCPELKEEIMRVYDKIREFLKQNKEVKKNETCDFN